MSLSKWVLSTKGGDDSRVHRWTGYGRKRRILAFQEYFTVVDEAVVMLTSGTRISAAAYLEEFVNSWWR